MLLICHFKCSVLFSELIVHISCFFHIILVCKALCVYYITDLLRIEKTSSGVVRERMKCQINRVLIGSVSVVVMLDDLTDKLVAGSVLF